jgi:cyanophycin synthetase
VAVEGNARDSIPLRDVPITRGGQLGFQVENAMAAVAAAWGLGLPTDVIRRGLASFNGDSDNAPGRFNVMDYRGATVIADYGHNPDAMRALVSAVDALPATRAWWSSAAPATGAIRTSASRRRSSAPPSTRCCSTRTPASAAARTARWWALLKKGLEGATRTRQVDEIRGEFNAIDHALAALQPGELCLVLVDQVEEALAHLRERCGA